MNKLINTIRLNNDIVVDFFDQSNRYFGDFHRIKINVSATIPFAVESLSPDLQKFAATYPRGVSYETTLERMGVTTSEVETITYSLINDFIESAGSYLEKKDFAERLLRKKMTMKNTPDKSRFNW